MSLDEGKKVEIGVDSSARQGFNPDRSAALGGFADIHKDR